MKKVRIIAGIAWAIGCLIIVILFFPSLNSLSSAASRLPFMKINPNYTGGEISHQIITPLCTLEIRKPVFDGLLNERKNGFVQLDWRGKIPEIISDTIDYNNDSVLDFCLSINTGNGLTMIDPLNPLVRNVKVSTPTSYGWALRVNLRQEEQ